MTNKKCDVYSPTKKYKYYTTSSPEKLKKAMEERSEDMFHFLMQLYAR